MLSRLENETDEQFAERLMCEKDDLGYSWTQIAEIINNECNWDYKPQTYRRKYYDIRKNNNETIDAPFYDRSKSIEELIELKKERYKIADERTQVNALIRKSARDELIKEIAHDFAQSMNSKFMLTTTEINHSGVKDGILLISDWHYGVDESNIFNTYNLEVAKQRIGQLLSETIAYIEEEQIKQLAVLNLGDLISGNIHLQLRINSKIDVITQIMEVSELLAEFINELTKHTSIVYGSVLDNHSRIMPDKKESIPLESLTRITDWFLKERLKGNNIIWLENSFGLDIMAFDFNNFKIAAVHGDKDKPTTVVKNLTSYTQNKFDLICSAHLHHFGANVENDTLWISNGSLIGTDDYAHSLRLNSNPSQTLLVIKNNKVEKIIKIDLD